ncbi:restriction endonuclease [Candidatus Riflebacteria bacterium]
MTVFKYKFDQLFNPLLQALHKLNGSGTISELEEKVAEILKLSNEEIEDIHRGNRTKLNYTLAWTRNYLKRYGLLENSKRGVWALTSKGLKTQKVNEKHIRKFVAGLSPKTKDQKIPTTADEGIAEELLEEQWQDKIIDILKNIEPDKFERLSQRVLRELGFTNVEVTGQPGDGGVDGVGVLKLGGVLSFHVVFQCKRYTNPVGAPAIRDFRGSMIGRADKGLFLTTSSFTRDAKIEAQRDGAPPIDLINGNDFALLLKDLKLGVQVELVEKITVIDDWFKDI